METYSKLSQGKHTCRKLEGSLDLPSSSLVSPFAIPLPCWLGIALIPALPGLVHLARWLLNHWWAGSPGRLAPAARLKASCLPFNP